MTRCALASIALAVTLAAATSASAQSPRKFPANALRGEIVVVQPPDIAVNGDAARLAPGARIYGMNNLLQMSASLVGPSMAVNYTLDNLGQVALVWILTDEERARKPWPTTLRQAQEWRFDPAAQVWSRP